MEAVRRAQEGRQAAAAAAAAAAHATAGGVPLPLLGGGVPQPAPVGEPAPMVMPLAALVADGPQAGLTAATPEAPEGVAAAAGGTPGERPGSGPGSGRPVRRTRSHDLAHSTPPGGLAQGNLSLPLPSSSSGGRGGGTPAAAGRTRRSPAGKPPAKPSARANRGVGPGKAARGGKHAASAHEGHTPTVPGERAPDLTRFGEGYQPQGPSTATPPKAWLLKAKDMKQGLQGKLVQVRSVPGCCGMGGCRGPCWGAAACALQVGVPAMHAAVAWTLVLAPFRPRARHDNTWPALPPSS